MTARAETPLDSGSAPFRSPDTHRFPDAACITAADFMRNGREVFVETNFPKSISPAISDLEVPGRCEAVRQIQRGSARDCSRGGPWRDRGRHCYAIGWCLGIRLRRGGAACFLRRRGDTGSGRRGLVPCNPGLSAFRCTGSGDRRFARCERLTLLRSGRRVWRGSRFRRLRRRLRFYRLCSLGLLLLRRIADAVLRRLRKLRGWRGGLLPLYWSDGRRCRGAFRRRRGKCWLTEKSAAGKHADPKQNNKRRQSIEPDSPFTRLADDLSKMVCEQCNVGIPTVAANLPGLPLRKRAQIFGQLFCARQRRTAYQYGNHANLAVEHHRGLGAHPIFFLIEASPVLVACSSPVRPYDNQRDVALLQGAIDDFRKNLAICDVIDILEHMVAEASAQRIAQTARPAITIRSAITDKDTGHADQVGSKSMPRIRRSVRKHRSRCPFGKTLVHLAHRSWASRHDHKFCAQ